MPKAKLKLVEPGLQDQLDAAITAAAAAHKSWQSAAAKLQNDFPGDHRFIVADLSRAVAVDPEQDANTPGAVLQSERVPFLQQREKVSDLQRQALEAGRTVEQLRTSIEASVTEVEHRAALAAAIAEAGKADEALQKIRATIARADSAVADAQERHGDAAKAVTVATEEQARTFAAALDQGHPPAHDSSVRDARRAADDAADELAVAKTAAATTRAKLGNAERRVADERKAIVICARNVLAARLPQLLQEAQAMQSQLEAKRVVLATLDRIAQKGTINPSDREKEIESFLSAPIFPYIFNGGSSEDHPAVQPWLEAIAALQTDAATTLPNN